MKKTLLTIAAVICCVLLISSSFTSCKENNAATSVTNGYSIGFDGVSFAATGADFTEAMDNWLNAIKAAYAQAIGVDSFPFTMEGTTEECDNKVLEGCKKAEETTLKEIGGGSCTVYITNTTSRRTIYKHKI